LNLFILQSAEYFDASIVCAVMKTISMQCAIPCKEYICISERSTIKRDIRECRLVELGVSDLTGRLFEVV
jgi:hypothetical protein